MTSYQDLGVKKIINACTTMTYLGGSIMPEEVTSAMIRASKSFVNIYDLHKKAGEYLAHLTKNEAAYVTTGCAAAIALSLLGIKTKSDPTKIKALVDDAQLDEVIVQNTHQIPYFPAISLAKSKAVFVGSKTKVEKNDFISAINNKTIATLFVAGAHLPQGGLTLDQVVEICRPRGIKVIVDAAAQLPPVENLWRFTKGSGADVALFSGGKALLGPQSSGLMLGSKEMIEWARTVGSPNQTLARSMKVGKEEIMGLVTAVERYVNLDQELQNEILEKRINFWINELKVSKNLRVERHDLNEAGQPVPRLLITVLDRSEKNLEQCLLQHDPSIAVLTQNEDSFWITPDLLNDEEVETVAKAILTIFS